MKKLYYLVISVFSLFFFPGAAFAITPMPVPEPASSFLIILGLLGILGFRRVFKK